MIILQGETLTKSGFFDMFLSSEIRSYNVTDE